MIRLLLTAALLWCVPAFGFSKVGTTYTTDGSQADVEAAISDSTAGDTVTVPEGSFTWGASGNAIPISKAITMQGAGTGVTVIALSTTGPSWASGVIQVSAAATVKSMTINGANSGHVAAFACSGTGWRITDIDFNGGTDEAYFAYVGGYGLFDNCTIDGGKASSELILGRGPTDSWQTAHSLGTTNAVYIEDCTFGTSGYVCDANSNARFSVRYNTITGAQKIDGHGLASNTPARGVRHMEVYGNSWTGTAVAHYTSIEMRGGSGMVWGNSMVGNGANHWFFLRDYGVEAAWSNFGSEYQTPDDYPIADQIGVGIDPKAAGSEPFYLWSNRSSVDSTPVDWPLTWAAVAAGAITAYGSTFTMQDIIAADRDYFKHTVGGSFDGTSGVGVGTKAQMDAITPTLAKVGFWVTDEGDWNSEVAGADGQLYVWDGDSWNLHYTPLTYPHPLRGGGSTPAVTRRMTATNARATTVRVGQ